MFNTSQPHERGVDARDAHEDGLPELGLHFWTGSCADLVLEMDRNGGFLVIPAASALCQAAEDENLWGALLSADYAIMDSGYLSLLLKFRRSPRPPRISGFQLLENLICADPVINIRERRILWVAPDCDEEDRIASHLAQHGFRPELQRYYNAPFYEREEDFHDTALLEIAGEFCPQWIVLCIGGGRQEKLGAFLRQQIGREAAIIGSGAAIGFFTGGQAPITRGIDRLYLGWLVRILHDPRRFLPRYAAAVKLPWLLHRLGAVKSSN